MVKKLYSYLLALVVGCALSFSYVPSATASFDKQMEKHMKKTAKKVVKHAIKEMHKGSENKRGRR